MQKDGCSIYVLIDALGWELLRTRPFLDDILIDRRRVQTILGYSCAAIPSLLTGQYPNGHGRWNLFYRSPETSPFRWTYPLLWLPRSARESRVTRRLVKEISHRLSGYTGYFAIYNLPLDRIHFFDICETADIYQPGGLAPARSIFDLFQENGVAYECYNYHSYTDEQILDLIPHRLKETDCRVYFLYLAEIDACLHFHLSDTDGVTAKLRWYEERLRKIYKAALARWGEARLYIFSDHGMTPIAATRDLIREVEALDLSVPADYLPAYDSTMARFWIFSDRAGARLRELLGSLSYGRLLSEVELNELGLDFNDDRYGQKVFLMKPGELICPSDMGRARFDGMHGFHPREDPSSYAVALSSVPITRNIEDITDVHSLMLDDLGISVNGGE